MCIYIYVTAEQPKRPPIQRGPLRLGAGGVQPKLQCKAVQCSAGQNSGFSQMLSSIAANCADEGT